MSGTPRSIAAWSGGSSATQLLCRARPRLPPRQRGHRFSRIAMTLLAIETSCDETSAAVLGRRGWRGRRFAAASSCRRISTRCSAGWSPSWRAGPISPRSWRWWIRPSPKRASSLTDIGGDRGDRGAGTGWRVAGRRDVRKDPGPPPGHSAHRRASPRGPPVRADPGASGIRPALRGPAGERRAHPAARRPGLGPVPAARVPPATMPPARRSTRSALCSAWVIPAGRRSSGWLAAARPGRFRFPRPMLNTLARRGSRPVQLLLQRAEDRRAARGQAEPRPRARSGGSGPGISGCGDRGAGREGGRPRSTACG